MRFAHSLASAAPTSVSRGEKSHARRHKSAVRVRSLLIGGVISAIFTIGLPVLLYAHGRLKSSTPTAGAHLAAVPHEIRLDFSEVPELTFTTIQLIGPTGAPVALTPIAYAADSKRSVVATVRGGLLAGDYTVIWQMAGDDGHVVRDRFRFVIAPGAIGVGVAGGVADTTSASHAAAMAGTEHQNPVTIPEGNGFGAESLAYVLVRWAMFTGLLIVIGAIAFRQLVLRFLRQKEQPDSPMLDIAARGAARFGFRAAAALLVIALLRLIAQSVSMHGAGSAFDAGLVTAIVTKTLWGHGWIAQVLGVLIAGLGFRLAKDAEPRSSRARQGWAIATVGAIGLAFTPAFAGHAASAPKLLLLTIIADGLHVAGAGGWLGSLLMVLFAGIPAALTLPEAERGPMVAELVNAFSPTALMFAGLVGATGVFAAWIHVGSIAAIWQSQYGKTLLTKLAVLSIVALTGAYNWLRVKPTLGQIKGAARIRRSATVEIVFGIVVLLITAILVATPTAMDMQM